MRNKIDSSENRDCEFSIYISQIVSYLCLKNLKPSYNKTITIIFLQRLCNTLYKEIIKENMTLLKYAKSFGATKGKVCLKILRTKFIA